MKIGQWKRVFSGSVALVAMSTVGLTAGEASAAGINTMIENLISNINSLPAAMTAIGFIGGTAGSVVSGWNLYQSTQGNGEIGDKAKYAGALALSGLLMSGSVVAGATQDSWGTGGSAPTYTKVTGPTIK